MLSVKTSVLAKPSRACAVRPVAATASTVVAKPVKELKPLNVTKKNLLDSQGGETTRNIDGAVYYISYNREKDEILVVNKQVGQRYPVTVDDSNRIRIDPAAGLPYAVAGFSQELYAPVLAASSIGAEICNGRTAMVAILGLAGTEIVTGQTVMQQASSSVGLAVAGVLGAAVLAASIAPAIAGKVAALKVFPDENDSFADAPLPYTWNALAEKLNGRVAMVGVAGMLISELARGTTALPHF